MRKPLFVIILIAVTLCLAQPSHAANPRVTIKVIGAVTGDIVVELYQDKAPVTVANFISYVQSGFYNNLLFHRVISGFMIQGGGFDQNLLQKTTGAPIFNESNNGISNLRGTIAMARTNQTHSATSQFFINTVDNTFLNYGQDLGGYLNVGYCVFGRVVTGLNVVDAISALPTTTKSNGMTDVPVNNVVIQSATVSTTGPVCATRLQGDINGDCKVNLVDIALLSSNWLKCNSTLQACP